MSDEELEERLQRLLLLLPDLRQKLASMRPQLVAALAAQVEQLPGGGGQRAWQCCCEQLWWCSLVSLAEVAHL